LTSRESSFAQDLNGDGTISTAATTIINSAAMDVEQSAATHIAHFISEKSIGSGQFNFVPQSGAIGIPEPEGFSLGSVGNRLLIELLSEGRGSERSTFLSIDDDQSMLNDPANHDIMTLLKSFLTLHADQFIIQ
jgi:hypothetical protein